MDNWRTSLKLASTSKPFTFDMIRNNEVKVGDFLSCEAGDIHSSKFDNKIAFEGGKFYKIIDMDSSSVILSSELGPYRVHFKSEDGGGQLFQVVQLDDDEKLGTFESIPMDILQLLDTHQYAKKTDLVEELSFKYGITKKEDKEKLAYDIFEITSILLKQGYITEYKRRMNLFEITDRGKIFLRK